MRIGAVNPLARFPLAPSTSCVERYDQRWPLSARCRIPPRGETKRMNAIDRVALDQLPLHQIEAVTFYKRDQITTDLICCDVEIGGKTWCLHEEVEGWDLLTKHLEQLPGFRSDWYTAVVRPPFAPSEIVAFRRD